MYMQSPIEDKRHAWYIMYHCGIVQYSAVPGPPSNIQRLCTVVVWQAPLQRNGNIIGYDLDFGGTNFRSLDASNNFYITFANERQPGTSVRVSPYLKCS